ncbi:hypothetical protein, partial [Burkholderia cenocepacia]|uniref:hypothetical protein n=1 Tax=Burkholderia cenocepacia TaxID=95486 RepID=UPI001BA1CE5A
IVFGTLHFGGSPVGELVLETRFSRIPREPPPSTFNYARDIACCRPPEGFAAVPFGTITKFLYPR